MSLEMKTGKQILLSISILVSGREETTKKCIDSLDSLRKKVSCELLLVDTGCPESMKEWLAQKADRIIPFPWCNDFAAARNAGLLAAKGEWFLFLDDDEWFESTAGLEHFFLSEEHGQYEAVSYLQRNYFDMEGNRWRDIPLTRMVRRREDTRVIYPIHESLWPIYEPVKYLEDYVHHYGYASPDAEEQREKRQRNLSLLLPLIESEPHCLHHYLQAVLEYIAAEDLNAALAAAEDGISHYMPDRADNGNGLYGLYAAVVRLLVQDKQYDKALRRGRELLAQEGISKLAETSICGDLVIACGGQCGQTAGTSNYRRYLGRYLENKSYFEEHKVELLRQQTIILDSCFEEYQYRMILGWGFLSVLSCGNAKEAEGMLGEEPTEWWMETEQNWYTQASVQDREYWRSHFQGMVDRIAQDRAECVYPRITQLYRALTSP